jgi:ABC-2 type transport system permease protein
VSSARWMSVALGIALRSARRLRKNPAQALPPMLIPLFFFAAFSGALSALASTPDFGYYNYTAFQFVFILYMGAMFTGVFSAFEIAGDYESGFGQRLALAAPQRLAIIIGYLIVAFARGVLVVAVLWAVALITGMPVRGNIADVTGLIGLALLLNVATALWGAGVALRFQTTASGVLILIPVFMVLFLTPVFAPRQTLSGWLRTAADVNPLTAAIEAGRSLLAGHPVHVVLAFATATGLVVGFALWAARGMRRAEKGPRGSAPRHPRRGPRARRAV